MTRKCLTFYSSFPALAIVLHFMPHAHSLFGNVYRFFVKNGNIKISYISQFHIFESLSINMKLFFLPLSHSLSFVATQWRHINNNISISGINNSNSVEKELKVTDVEMYSQFRWRIIIINCDLDFNWISFQRDKRLFVLMWRGKSRMIKFCAWIL
jgi:hypothetical protein